MQRGVTAPWRSGKPSGIPSASASSRSGNDLARFFVRGGLGVVLLAVTSCSWVSGIFGGEDSSDAPQSISVFDVQPGQCFNPPADPRVEVPELSLVPCDQAHLQEAYSVADYVIPQGAADTFPGKSALTTFADGACAEAFLGYVGVSYLDSSLYYTYLLPSARGWEQGNDRKIVCFVTTTGETLMASVADSKR